jgi:hypothetical protein
MSRFNAFRVTYGFKCRMSVSVSRRGTCDDEAFDGKASPVTCAIRSRVLRFSHTVLSPGRLRFVETFYIHVRNL